MSNHTSKRGDLDVAWKVYTKTSTGLLWYRDADKWGTFLRYTGEAGGGGKHKGDVGYFIGKENAVKLVITIVDARTYIDYMRNQSTSARNTDLEVVDSVWRDLLDNYPEQRLNLAFSRDTPRHVLDELAVDADDEVRMAVSSRRNLSPQVMHILAEDPSQDIRANLAFNPKLTEDAKIILRQDPSSWVQSAIARSSSGNKQP